MTELGARLGLNVHRDQWPTTPLLASYEAAGFSWAQVHTPPRPMLADRERCRRHARALRAALAPSGLRLLIHGPDDLSAGTIEHDRAFDGLMDYAVEAGAELVVYHGLDHPVAEGSAATERLRERIAAEERSLRRFAARAEALGLVIAVENLAPAYPSPPTPSRVCHDPLAVRDLPPGAGCLPWDRLGPLLAAHAAPLMLEVERSHGAAPAALASQTAALLARRPVAAAA
jgi:sugar phosphate isomerase/epimerase